MSELTSLLVRSGVLTEAQAQAIGERAGVDALLASGTLDEATLVRFCRRKLVIPAASDALLATLPRSLADRLPAETAHRLGVVVLGGRPGRPITVATADPTDHAALREAGRLLGSPVVPAVATRSALTSALLRLYGPAPRDEAPPRTGPPATAPEGPRRWTPQVVPTPAPETPPVSVRAATKPRPVTRPPTPLPVAVEPDPLSPEAFAQVFPRLVTATDRDRITEVLLEFLATGFARVIVFVHTQGEFRGRDARGDDLDAEAVRQVRIPADAPSSFRTVLEQRRPHLAPLRRDAEVDVALAEALGGIEGNVLLLPVVLRDKVPLLVFAAGSRWPVHPQSLKDLAEAASLSLERLIAARKTPVPRSG